LTAKAKKKAKKHGKAFSPISAIKRRPREDMTAVVINARIRHHGLTLDQAKHERASTALGRAFLADKIDDTLYRAGEEYKRLHTAYMRAINAPDGFAVSDCGDSGSETSEAYVEWAIRAVGHFSAIQASLVDDGAFQSVVTESLVIEDRDQPPTHIGYAIAGLRFLSRKLGIST